MREKRLYDIMVGDEDEQVHLLERSYRLPSEIVEQFEEAVSPDGRSVVIADLLRSWLDSQRGEQLRRDVIAGCREMAEVYLKIEREYHPLEEELERGKDNDAKGNTR